ncbi:LacI family transcriptional regulator [Endozoicomonas sp. OPT23]|uniref:LacI family DNA-binding transcriptional regulator n=1 Tax=Endozoicomonas sp. OPT23 TaxID=2072845 RepID=UPI00129A9FCA|nr:LacI family DNA-binding transcriptional regulator [Endozoicomonas sp. OPT23]MRI35115.1 LacI family transcriptional regulator [Endozoicomonas sp. OPT23]
MTKSIFEIAQLAEVSVTTVRLVINGQDQKYRISEKTRSRIQSIIDEHGYYINQTARNLKLRKTQTLGLVVPRLSNLFFSQLIEILEVSCRNAGYQLITVCSYDDPALEQNLTENLIQREVDGLFVVSSSRESQLKLAKLCQKPVVFLDRNFDVDGISSVTTDNIQGGYQLGCVMAKKLNGRELFVLGADGWLPTIQNRIAGLKSGLADSGYQLPEQDIVIKGLAVADWDNCIKTMEELCQNRGVPKALVTSSLPVFEGCMQYLVSEYGSIPQDMLLGTYDEHSSLNFIPNQVVSVCQNAEGIAESAFEMMLKKINKEELLDTVRVIKSNLVIR